MSQAVLQGDPPITVTMRRSARARRMTLRVSHLDGRVTLTLPRGVPEREGLGFAREREDWIRSHLDQRAEPNVMCLGADLPVFGDPRVIVQGSGRQIVLSDGQIAVPGPAETTARKLKAWLHQTARAELALASDRYANALGRSYSRLTLRDTRSRWGSCSSTGGLMYSWRLVMAPRSVLDYVAAHEVAHLAEMNHSPAFWAVVERLYGDHMPPRRWLKQNGHTLHAYQF